ncbi:ATP-binding protein [Bifidobacterium biavatii]|uniref:Putative ATPase (AAA superfamily) n=1 Tax=Bifidobacterium biavatii DSM 23969 TaxID=1437608 RepID=A0A087A149_9BIFI|nr:ATP-binding protein [Bifidobacterium biavatii]KFI52499.1 putative ATPase (AAA superfamily) [Bifidobacterium biavatii DSM 23969]
MANPIIEEKLRSFRIEDFQPIVPRELDLGRPLQPKIGNLAKVIVGMRRSGKSYRLFQEMEALHASGIDWNHICYINFEDDRLGDVTPETGDEALETFYAMHPESMRDGIYLFFDELQEMQGWGRWLRRIIDTTKATVYVTGSSSKMLSKEISTEFRGRALDFELLPFSFREFVRANGIADDELLHRSSQSGYSTEERLILSNAMTRYLEEGGFPAAQGLPTPQRVALLQSYVQRVVSRDVVERYDIARPRVAAMMARRVLGCNGKTLSVRKIENELRSAGLTTSRELLGDLLEYFEDAYLVFRMREFSMALREKTTSMPKVYAIDPGLAAAASTASSKDEGQRLGNAVYLELRRRTIGFRRDGISSCHTQAHGYEVDFVVGDVLEQEQYELCQVTAAMDDPKTVERETRALWELMEERGLKEGAIIVGQGKECEYHRNGFVIRQIPAWKWFLNNSK